MEKVLRGGVTEYKHYIPASSSSFIVYTRKSSGGSATTNYVVRDHLGSSTVVTDGSGTELVQLSFAPWGGRRKETWQDVPLSGDWAQITATTRRGFTGHEHLDNVGLVHMNGRIFDEVVGRFLSTDPVIDASTSQGVNSYSYVNNNPLTLIDPSGYQAEEIVVRARQINGLGRPNIISPGVSRAVLGAQGGGAGGGRPQRRYVTGSRIGKDVNAVPFPYLTTDTDVALGVVIPVGEAAVWAVAAVGMALLTQLREMDVSDILGIEPVTLYHYSEVPELVGGVLDRENFLTPQADLSCQGACSQLALPPDRNGKQLYRYTFNYLYPVRDFLPSPWGVIGTLVSPQPKWGRLGYGIEYVNTRPLIPSGPGVPIRP